MALVSVLVLLSVARAASGVWPDCNFQCTANDVTVISAWLGNATGAELEQCEPGQPNGSAYVWVTLYNNAGTSRYAVHILGDLYVDDVLVPIDQCALDSIPKKETRDYCMHDFPWHCGEAVRLENLIVAWQTSPHSSCSDPAACPPGGQCAFSANMTVAAPLIANFLTNSPQCFCTDIDFTDIDFTDATTGGELPYTYSWDFGDGVGTSAEQDPSYHYSAPGSYNVTLSVTDIGARFDSHTEEVQVLSDADLEIAKTDAPDPVYAGGMLTYTVTVANNGPCAAHDVVVTDALPPLLSGAEYSVDGGTQWLPYGGNVTLGEMPSSDNREVLVRAVAGCPEQCTQEIVNTATVSHAGYDPDPANNSATADTTVTDNTPPSVTSWPNDVTVHCVADVPPPEVGNVTATDNCRQVFVAHLCDEDDGQSCPKTIVRTYGVTDGCGNFVNVTQTITVNDTIAPFLTPPPDATIECDESVDPSNTGDVAIVDNCGDAEVAYADVETAGTCPEKKTITRTWTAVDGCGNTANATQTIVLVDTTPPVITSWPEDVAVQCLDEVPPPDVANVTATDNCGNVAFFHVGDDDDGNTCPRTIVRTYRATDECGNSANVTQTIIVDDTIAPQLVCPPHITVGCQESTDPSNTGYATATDNCDADVDIDYSDESSGELGSGGGHGSYHDTETSGSPCHEMIARTWTAADDCGNVAECLQIISRIDLPATPTPGPMVGGIVVPADKSGLGASGILAAALAGRPGLVVVPVAAALLVAAAAFLAVWHRRRAAQRRSP